MLLEAQAKELLEAKANEIYTGDAGKGARVSYARLKVRSFSASAAASEKDCERVAGYLRNRGQLLEETEQCLRVMTGSGVKYMNPTVVELVLEGGMLQITAWAKEGMIPQRSAEKAVKDCLKALKAD